MSKENEQGKPPAARGKGAAAENFNALDSEIAQYWLSALIESAGDAIVSKTLDGIVTSWNNGAERIFGYTAAEMIGRPILTLIPPERHGEEREILGKIRAGRRVEHYETIRRRKDGTLINISLTVSPIKDKDGKIIGASKIARDVTRLKQTEEKIRASEERYRTLFNSIDEGFCVIQMLFDADGKPYDYRFLEINPIFEEQTGLVGAQGKTMLELVPNHDESWFEVYGRVAATGEAIRFENYAAALDRWFDLYALRVGAPEERKIAVLFKNITDRKRAEIGLRKSDARLRLALDISQTSTFEIDLLTDEVQTDEIGREIYGFEKDEPLTFAQVQSHFHPEDRDYVMESVARALDPLSDSDEFEVEQRIIRADGETRWIKVRGRAFFEGEDDARRAVTCLGTYIDITERKAAERERERLLRQLEAERARLQYLFTKAPAFVATLRGPQHIFELTNPAYLQLIGHRDVNGKPARAALPEVEGQGFFQLLDQVFQTGEAYTGRELPVQLQREEYGPLEQRFVDFVYQPIFDADGAVSGIFVHGVDITEQVRARKEAEEANRAKDEFLATLSHELRTPLNAILGWAKMMGDNRLDEDSRRRALETIQRNARIQAQLIDDILDVSRIISGKLKLEIRPIELASVVELAVASVLPAAEAKDIRLQRVLDYGKSMVSGDPNRLQQVVWNLLSNAVKFTPKGGRVQIRLERVNSHVEIIVSDTGIGIPPKVLPFIFDRFRQADSATTRQHGGLGLGLAIVRHLVEMHGGTVEAESGGENQGSTFTVRLPLIALRSMEINSEAGSAAGSAAAPREHPTDSGRDVPFECTPELEGLHVLVVDDEEDGRRLVATVLRQCGAQVTEANSAADGFKAVRDLRPDVLISDLGMPGEDGYSLIKKVRALPPEQGGQIPAAALTAYARVEDRMRVLRAGFQIHLPKPVEPAELVAVVASLSGRHDATD
jgi:PAS domain S-box-containing protein